MSGFRAKISNPDLPNMKQEQITTSQRSSWTSTNYAKIRMTAVNWCPVSQIRLGIWYVYVYGVNINVLWRISRWFLDCPALQLRVSRHGLQAESLGLANGRNAVFCGGGGCVVRQRRRYATALRRTHRRHTVVSSARPAWRIVCSTGHAITLVTAFQLCWYQWDKKLLRNF
jgi:hypothetical protein